MNGLLLRSLRSQRTPKSLLSLANASSFSRFRRFKEKQEERQMEAAIPQSTDEIFSKESAYSEVQSNLALKNFLNKCYMYTGASVGGFLTISQVSIMTGVAHTPAVAFLSLGALVPLIGMSYIQPTFSRDHNGHMQCHNTPARLACFWSSVGMMGVGISPYMMAMTMGQPGLLPAAVLVTTGVCAGASLFAYSRPSDSLLYLKGPLFGCLLSMIGLQLAGGLCAYAGMGTGLMAMSHQISLYGGLAIFTGFMAYDTHGAIQMFKEDRPDHLQVAMDLFLNFKNLLIRIMAIMRNDD